MSDAKVVACPSCGKKNQIPVLATRTGALLGR